MPGIKKLLFVDTNKWLDFYRGRTEAALSLLNHLDAVADSIIVTYQLEMEFKKNRQIAMLEGLEGLKPTGQQLARPGLFSDAKATRAMLASQKRAAGQAQKLREKMVRALKNPTISDPVYKVFQRISRKDDSLVLSEADSRKCHANRRAALRRFLQGYPPRKKGDTSMGDAINWEWMISCAIDQKAELVIVTRDGDYGAAFDGQVFLNDYLRQEFSARVSRKREVRLVSKLSDALKLFKVRVTPAEVAEEEHIAQPQVKEPQTLLDILSSPSFKWTPTAAGLESKLTGLGGIADIEDILAKIDTSGLTSAVRGIDTSGLTSAVRGIDTSGLTSAVKGIDTSGLASTVKGIDTSGLTSAMKDIDTSGLTSAVRGIDTSGLTSTVKGIDTSGLTSAMKDIDTSAIAAAMKGVSAIASGDEDGVNVEGRPSPPAKGED